MNDGQDFEMRMTRVFSDYADRAPVDVDPISMTATVARRRSRLAWPTFTRRGSWLVIGAVLTLVALGAALVVGSSLLRPHVSPGGGGLILINQAEWPGYDATRHVTLHVFGLDEATGVRVPIADVPPSGRSWGWMSAVWSPDHLSALLTDGGGSVLGIVDVATHRLSPLQLKPGDTNISLADRLPWSRASDRIVSIVSNDTTNTQGSILISDLAGREVGRLAMPSGWGAGRPTWSPDGSSVILEGCQQPCADGSSASHLLLVPIDGSPVRVLLDPAASYGPAVWSPDGSTIVFESSIGIQTMDVATGRQSIVTRGTDSQPAWSPDGRRIAFARAGDGAIYVVDIDGKNLRRLAEGIQSGEAINPDWSPDGTMLTYGRTGSPYFDVWVVGADGGEPRQLIKNATSDW